VAHALNKKRGNWMSVAEIHRRVGPMRLNSRISELRKHGYTIEHRTVKGKPRASLTHQYRLVDGPDLPVQSDGPERTVLNRNTVPRDQQHRFRIYRVFRGELELVATTAGGEAAWNLLMALGRGGEFAESCLGINDSHGNQEGEWVISPWDVNPQS